VLVSGVLQIMVSKSLAQVQDVSATHHLKYSDYQVTMDGSSVTGITPKYFAQFPFYCEVSS
jgi:hypothetical protein